MGMGMDYSGSMYGTIDYLEPAMKKLIKEKKPEDRISLLKFDDQMNFRVKNNREEEQILKGADFQGLDKMGGGTALYAAIGFMSQELAKEAGQKVLIIFTDGWENSSREYYGQYPSELMEVIRTAIDNSIPIFPVGFEGSNIEELNAIASLTNGRAFYIQEPSEIGKVYKEIPMILENYCQISFKPTPTNGKYTTELVYNNLMSTTSSSRRTHTNESCSISAYAGMDNIVGNEPIAIETEEDEEPYGQEGRVLTNSNIGVVTPCECKDSSL